LQYLPHQELTWRSTATIALRDAYDMNGDMAAAYQTRIGGLETSKATGDIYLTLIANMKVVVTLRMQGQLKRVLKICQGKWRLRRKVGYRNQW
jgi:hypothetical protein